MKKNTLIIAGVFSVCMAAAFWAGLYLSGSQSSGDRLGELVSSNSSKGRIAPTGTARTRSKSGPGAISPGSAADRPVINSSLLGASAISQFTADEVSERAAGIFLTEDPIEKMEAWLAFVKGLQGNEQMEAALEGNFSGRDRGRELSLALTMWSRRDPEAALAWASKQGGWVMERGSGTVLAEWAKASPDQAIAWAQAHPPKDKKQGNWHMVSVLNTVAKLDPVRALELAQSMDRSVARGEAMDTVISNYINQHGNDGARTAIELLPESTFRTGILGRLAGRMAETDPANTAQWAVGITDKGARPRAITEAIDDWAEQNPNDAGKWLNEQPRNSEMDEPRERFAWKVQEQDPESAIAWATTISDERRRNETSYRLVREWMQRDPEKAKAWVTASTSLSPEIRERLLSRNRG